MDEQAIERQVDRVLSLGGIENTDEVRKIARQIICAELSEPRTRGGIVTKQQIERWRRSSPAALPRIMKLELHFDTLKPEE